MAFCVLNSASVAKTRSKVSHWALSCWRRIKVLGLKLEELKHGIFT